MPTMCWLIIVQNSGWQWLVKAPYWIDGRGQELYQQSEGWLLETLCLDWFNTFCLLFIARIKMFLLSSDKRTGQFFNNKKENTAVIFFISAQVYQGFHTYWNVWNHFLSFLMPFSKLYPKVSLFSCLIQQISSRWNPLKLFPNQWS